MPGVEWAKKIATDSPTRRVTPRKKD